MLMEVMAGLSSSYVSFGYGKFSRGFYVVLVLVNFTVMGNSQSKVNARTLMKEYGWGVANLPQQATAWNGSQTMDGESCILIFVREQGHFSKISQCTWRWWVKAEKRINFMCLKKLYTVNSWFLSFLFLESLGYFELAAWFWQNPYTLALRLPSFPQKLYSWIPQNRFSVCGHYFNCIPQGSGVQSVFNWLSSCWCAGCHKKLQCPQRP